MAFTEIISFLLHLDRHLAWLFQEYGFWVYAILFAIIFLETGLVITPFLPGDSLIFAAGAFSAQGSLNVLLLFFLLTAAAILGDTINYWAGYHLGKRVFHDNIRFIKKEYLLKTEKFYVKHGKKTIILARFIPIIRTFAPFVAGVGRMQYNTFIAYNIIGGVFWVSLFVFTGYFFGNMRFIKENFTIFILAIILLSFVPVLWGWWNHRKSMKKPVKHKTI